ncbi:transcription factor bHLH57-like [Gastrolobium bilobum]|uniref:transcription factor bHLH57-like n=1 Tax=Gastrolobium bilobum TaxID=150636 RepID=UPI002AB1D3C5|nr:transcription factor bHLH57-like [Gastrolobium bilobum]
MRLGDKARSLPRSQPFFGENCLEQGFFGTESLKLEKDEQSLISSLEDNMPFLQMLQSVESPQISPFKEPSFQTLIRLQHLKKPWEGIACIPRFETQELESCVTNDLVEMQSPLKSESNDLQHPHSIATQCNQERPKSAQDCSKDGIGDSAAVWANSQSWHKGTQTQCPKTQLATRERRKRKRTRQTKNKEDVENQRMTHIAVERNRRRQMNDHLSVLKSLMPPSYIQRGDHASIIGGAIDFVKELEQLLQSLEAQKKMRKNDYVGSSELFEFEPGYEMSSSPKEAKCGDEVKEAKCGGEVKAEKKSQAVAVEVTGIQTHVNLKIQCQRRHGQLIKAIVALEDLRLTILHLNITSLEASVLYSFNLKIEEDSKIGSASEIAEAVDQIFSSINGI